jgi:hypothetical protein
MAAEKSPDGLATTGGYSAPRAAKASCAHRAGFSRRARRLIHVTAVLALLGLVTITEARAAHRQLWLCIHTNERSAWNDPNPPYYGGLQMGWWFMRTYAKRELAYYGTADRWPAEVQIGVAERAYRRERFSRSWLLSQWPNTGPPCLVYA